MAIKLKNEGVVNSKNEEIKKLEEMVVKLSKEFETTKESDDIYGENKKGFFGSNLMDLWKKKK